jgi:hypothetical protein
MTCAHFIVVYTLTRSRTPYAGEVSFEYRAHASLNPARL